MQLCVTRLFILELCRAGGTYATCTPMPVAVRVLMVFTLHMAGLLRAADDHMVPKRNAHEHREPARACSHQLIDVR